MSVVLFRQSLAEEGEFAVCKKYFETVEQRTLCPPGLVIGRYSVLPYYQELAADLKGNLINSYRQHCWVADFEYYQELKQYTPETWDETNFYRSTHPGPFVVKGKTNSRKLSWDTDMFALTRRDVSRVAGLLHNDGYLGSQDIIIRKYVPLKTYEIGIHGLPFTNEWRVFCFGETILSVGYYWSCASDETLAQATWETGAERLVNAIMPVVSRHVNFYTLDVAQTVTGDWILIEINDGQMSGLSENDPDTLYKNLRIAIE